MSIAYIEGVSAFVGLGLSRLLIKCTERRQKSHTLWLNPPAARHRTAAGSQDADDIGPLFKSSVYCQTQCHFLVVCWVLL
jgi:hypothetical protein